MKRRRQSQANRGFPVTRTSPWAAAMVQPTLSTVSSIPGIERAAPDRTDTSNGRRRSPNSLRVVASRNSIPSAKPSANFSIARPSPLTMAAHRSTGSTKAGGTGRPRAVMRARLAALAPTTSAGCLLPHPSPIRTICIASPSREQISEDAPTQQVPEPGQPVGRSFDCTGKFDYRQRCFQIEFTAEDERSERAFGGIAVVFGLDQAVDRRQRVFHIYALPIRAVASGRGTRGGGFRTGNRNQAQFGQRLKQFRRDIARQQRRKECRLLEFVDCFLDPVNQLFDHRVSVETRYLVARTDDDLVGLLLATSGSDRKGLAVNWLPRLPFSNIICEANCDIPRQPGLAHHDRQ